MSTDGRSPASRRADMPIAEGELDADLARLVRRTSIVRQGFYVVVLLVALAGQVSGAVEALHIPLAAAIPAVGALELGGIVVLANADVRRRLGERAVASRLLSVAIAAAAVTFNWLAHKDHLLGGFFAGMSALGYLVWLMHTENQRRDRLRIKGDLPPTTPAYEVGGHWLRHPMLTVRARALAKADPRLGLYDSLATARADVRRERRQAAIAKVLHRKIRSAVDPRTADIAIAVYDLDEIAARLADRADYDGLTTLIAADLAPERLAPATAAGAERARKRTAGRRAAGTETGADMSPAGADTDRPDRETPASVLVDGRTDADGQRIVRDPDAGREHLDADQGPDVDGGVRRDPDHLPRQRRRSVDGVGTTGDGDPAAAAGSGVEDALAGVTQPADRPAAIDDTVAFEAVPADPSARRTRRVATDDAVPAGRARGRVRRGDVAPADGTPVAPLPSMFTEIRRTFGHLQRGDAEEIRGSGTDTLDDGVRGSGSGANVPDGDTSFAGEAPRTERALGIDGRPEPSLRKRVHDALDANVLPGDQRDDTELLNLVFDELRLTDLERLSAQTYVRSWKQETLAGERIRAV